MDREKTFILASVKAEHHQDLSHLPIQLYYTASLYWTTRFKFCKSLNGFAVSCTRIKAVTFLIVPCDFEAQIS